MTEVLPVLPPTAPLTLKSHKRHESFFKAQDIHLKIYQNFDFRTQWICSTSKILQRRRIFILHSIRATKIPIRKEEKIQCEKISEWPFWSFLRNTLLSALFYKKAISLWRTLCCRSWSCLLAFFKRNNGLFLDFPRKYTIISFIL